MGTPEWFRHEDVDRETDLQHVVEASAWSDRRAILLLLALRPTVVSELVAAMGSNMPHVSNHLRVLRKSNLVLYDQLKREHLYSLTAAVRITVARGRILFEIAAENGETARLEEFPHRPWFACRPAVASAVAALAARSTGPGPSPPEVRVLPLVSPRCRERGTDRPR